MNLKENHACIEPRVWFVYWIKLRLVSGREFQRETKLQLSTGDKGRGSDYTTQQIHVNCVHRGRRCCKHRSPPTPEVTTRGPQQDSPLPVYQLHHAGASLKCC